MPTGIDRVERAYLDHFVRDDVPTFGLIRTAFGYLLLDRAGMIAFHDRLRGTVEWAAYLELAMLNMSPRQAAFWHRLKSHASAEAAWARQYEDFSQLPYQFLAAGHDKVTVNTGL